VRRAILILVGTLLLVMLAAGAAYLYARQSLPMIDGTISVAGPSAPIDIVRDADAVPHVFATTKIDGLFGLGYVHAQDRLWQMEFQRRIGFGRLAEVLGEAALPQDRFLRTVGFGRAARAAWDRQPQRTRQEVEAYVAGVNAFLSTHHGRALPPEFTLLGFAPEPWTGPDVVVWQKMMAWDLSVNYSLELLRHDIVGAVGTEGLADLMPPYAEEGLSILGTAAGWPVEQGRASRVETPGHVFRDFVRSWPSRIHGTGSTALSTGSASSRSIVPALPSLVAALRHGPPAVTDFLFEGSRIEAIGSNNWVVDGSLTASGKPMLANDPHLGARAPSLWYLAHVSAGEYDAIGATIPGTPAIVLGRNRFVAWGATNVAADVQDLYLEHIDATGRFAEFRGRQEPLQITAETILVKGRSPVRIEVRVSRHGPLVSDAINAMNQASPAKRAAPPLEPMAFRWTALDADDTTITAMMRISEAHTWTAFTEACRDFVVPSQNFVYADVDGHIGYLAPGRIPIRKSGDGSQPAAGWTGESEWTGWIPFEELPRAFDPPSHLIVTANQRPTLAGDPHLLGVEWPESYRAQRILERLQQKTKLTPDDFASIQSDTQSMHAREVLPILLEHAQPYDTADAEAIRLLRRWNYDARGDSAAAALFEAWFLHLAPTMVGDDLGPLITESYEGRFSYVTRFVLRTLTRAPSAAPRQDQGESGPPESARNWCDDRRTAPIETCDDAVSKALDDAVKDLTRRIGGDMVRWRWDAVHHAMFPHSPFDNVALLRPLFSRSIASAGDWSTVDVGAVAADHRYEQRSVASYREIVDLSPENDSRFADALGQSGHPLSRHYDDFLQGWRAVTHRPMRMDRREIERDAIGRLRLTP
jgi:penicillin amidase